MGLFPLRGHLEISDNVLQMLHFIGPHRQVLLALCQRVRGMHHMASQLSRCLGDMLIQRRVE